MDSTASATLDQPQVVLAREPAFRLGAAEVRPASREVVGPRRTETLEPRVMQVLVALARADGGILTRDDLIAACWEGRAVSEDAITRVMSRLRRLAEELGPSAFAVETITKVGYRLLPAGHVPASVAAQLPSGVGSPSRRALVFGGGAVAGAAAAAAGGWAWWRGRDRASPRARELYARGREAIDKGMVVDNAQAVAFLKAAVAESPDYADAWGALSLAYLAGLGFVEPSQQPGVNARAQAAAHRALELDRNQADALTTQALVTPLYQHWGEAEARILQALHRLPTNPRLLINHSLLLLSVGRAREAVTEAQAATARAPFGPWYAYGLAACLWSVGRIDEAESTLREALKLFPRQHALWFRLFYFLSHTGRGDQAIALAADRAGRPVTVTDENIELHLPAARAMMTRAAADIDVAARLQVEAARRGIGYAENAVDWLSGLGRVDDAYRVARAMYFNEGFTIPEQRFQGGEIRYQTERSRNTAQLFMPPNAKLRADPRFAALARDVGLAGYWRTSGKAPDPAIWTPPRGT